ncbi:MAG: TerB family tellurite resistance protein [Desulfobacterales bacterium]|jgi:uncharacterized tellurite resistance protein B-like protein
MFDVVKHFLSKEETRNDETVPETGHDILVATCALLVEIAQIDKTFTEDEMTTVLSILKGKYGLSKEHADALIAEAEKQLEESVDLWQFARLINENYSNEEKMEIIETMWRIVYVDGKMDQYEQYLMNKMKNLLRISHDQLIDAKLKVKYSNQQRNNG